MTLIRAFMDWSQVFLAIACALYGFHVLVIVDKTKKKMDEHELQHLYSREKCRFSIQTRAGIIVVYSLYFAMIQFTWTIDTASSTLNLSEDFRWFVDGVLKFLILITGLQIYKRLWTNWTKFREGDK